MRRIRKVASMCWCALTDIARDWVEHVRGDALWRVISEYVIITLIALLLLLLAYLWRFD